jgi:hypothetical protein
MDFKLSAPNNKNNNNNTHCTLGARHQRATLLCLSTYGSDYGTVLLYVVIRGADLLGEVGGSRPWDTCAITIRHGVRGLPPSPNISKGLRWSGWLARIWCGCK